MPKLRGKTLAGARLALTRARCRLGVVKRAPSATVPRNRVVSQTRAAGARLPVRTQVGVTLSNGPKRRF